jgi:hypothetical protein
VCTCFVFPTCLCFATSSRRTRIIATEEPQALEAEASSAPYQNLVIETNGTDETPAASIPAMEDSAEFVPEPLQKHMSINLISAAIHTKPWILRLTSHQTTTPVAMMSLTTTSGSDLEILLILHSIRHAILTSVQLFHIIQNERSHKSGLLTYV